MKPRIGLVYFGSYPETRIIKFANTLTQAGFNLSLLCRYIRSDGHSGTASKRSEVTNWQVTSLQDGATSRFGTALSMPYPFNPVWCHAIRQLITENHCELLIIRDLPLMLASVAVAKPYGIPIIFDMAENYPAALAVWRRYEGAANYIKNGLLRNVTLARLTERWACRLCDRIIVVVVESAQRVHTMGIAQDKVTIIENTPDLSTYETGTANCKCPTRADNSSTRLIYTGEMHIYRGVDTCIEAFTNPRFPSSVVMWMVGTGKKEQYFRDMTSRLKLTDRISWYGWQPHNRLLALIQQADIGLIPHYRNALTDYTMPNKIYDYMAFAKPVIASDASPMVRLVKQTHCGVYFRAHNLIDMACQVRLLQDPQTRREMGTNGLQAVQERYNWSVDGANLIALVNSIL